MKFHVLLIALIAAVSLGSCKSKQTILPYFTDLPETTGELEVMDYGTIIKPDDELLISVTSSMPEATAYYNLMAQNPATRASSTMTTTPQQQTYVVSPAGDIEFPLLGKIHVAGLTIEQLQEELTRRIRADVSDAIVTVKLVNFTVVVAGEVSRPSRMVVTRERYSLLDALGQAGDITPYGERENILVIREENGRRIYGRINLNKAESLTSPFFYLQPNDYVYVEPNHVRQSNAKYNQDNAFKLSVISTIVSACSVVASLVIALAVK